MSSYQNESNKRSKSRRGVTDVYYVKNGSSTVQNNNTPKKADSRTYRKAGASQDTGEIGLPSAESLPIKKPNKLRKRRVMINVIASVLGSIMILAGCGLIVLYTYFHRINYQEITVDSETKSTQTSHFSPLQNSGSAAEPINTYSGELLNDPMVLNIMLFGEDTRANATTAGNSDTMVIFSIDTRHKKMKMLSLMRDTYVDIPGYGENRLNAAYTYGGAGLTVSTIQKNYGIKIDRYAVVDFASFKQIINTLGGIDVRLTPEEVDYINWQSWINEQPEYKNADPYYKEDIRANLRYVWMSSVAEEDKPINKDKLTFRENKDGVLQAKVHLNGRQALWHARNRGEDDICSGDDFTRTQRQREVISIIINSLKHSDLPTILSVIYEIGPMITTNIKTSEITSLASDITTYLSYDIVSEAAPKVNTIGSSFHFSSEDHPIYIDGQFSSVILISDWDDFRQQVAEFIYEEQVARPKEEE